MKPEDLLYNALATITGGLINDMFTMCSALIAIGIIAAGMRKLMEVIGVFMGEKEAYAHLANARRYKKLAGESSHDEILSEYYARKSRSEVRRAAQ